MGSTVARLPSDRASCRAGTIATSHAEPVERRHDVRVVIVGHTLISRSSRRARFVEEDAHGRFDTHVVAPARWYENERWLDVDTASPDERQVHILPVRMPRFGNAKWYLHHYPELRRVIVGINPHVFHVWEEPWSLVALQMVHFRNKIAPWAPVVLEVEQNISKRLPPPFEQIRSYVLRNTDHVLARNTEALSIVREKGYAGEAS